MWGGRATTLCRRSCNLGLPTAALLPVHQLFLSHVSDFFPLCCRLAIVGSYRLSGTARCGPSPRVAVGFTNYQSYAPGWNRKQWLMPWPPMRADRVYVGGTLSFQSTPIVNVTRSFGGAGTLGRPRAGLWRRPLRGQLGMVYLTEAAWYQHRWHTIRQGYGRSGDAVRRRVRAGPHQSGYPASG